MPEKKILEINEVYGRLPSASSKLTKAKGIYLGNKEVHKIYYKAPEELKVVYNRLPYTLEQLKDIQVDSSGGDPIRFIKDGDIDSYKTDKIDGKVKVGVSSPDTIKPNTSKESITGSFRVIQKTSGLEIKCNYTQDGNVSKTTYDNPVLLSIYCPEVEANGNCSATISAKFKQRKHIVNTYTEEVTHVDLERTVEVEKASGTAIVIGAGIRYGNKPFGPNLENNVTYKRSIFNITEITIKDASGSNFTFSGISGYSVVQKENKKSLLWSNYKISATSSTKDFPTKGGSINITIESSATITPRYSSGMTDYNGAYPGYPPCKISTSLGELSKTSITGTGTTSLTVGENTDTKIRMIEVVASCNGGATKSIINFKQLGKATVNKEDWSSPVITSCTCKPIPADGIDSEGITVNYTQTKTIHYSDGTSQTETLKGTSLASGITGTNIYPGMNVHIESLHVVGKNLENTETPERAVFNVTGITFEAKDKIYTVAYGLVISQKENKITSSKNENYKLSLELADPEKNKVSSAGEDVVLNISSVCKRTNTWSSGYDKDIEENYAAECTLKVESTNNRATLDKQVSSGISTVTVSIPKIDKEETVKSNSITVSAFLDEISKSVSISQEELKETVSYKNPVVTGLNYDDISAKGIGGVITVDLQYTKVTKLSNGTTNEESCESAFTADDITYDVIDSSGALFNIDGKNLIADDLGTTAKLRRKVMLIKTVTLKTGLLDDNDTKNLSTNDNGYYVFQEENSKSQTKEDTIVKVSSNKLEVGGTGDNCTITVECYTSTKYLWTSGSTNEIRTDKECNLSVTSFDDVRLESTKLPVEKRSTTLVIGEYKGTGERSIEVTGSYGEVYSTPVIIKQNESDYVFNTISSPGIISREGGAVEIVYNSTRNKNMVTLSTRDFSLSGISGAIIKSIINTGGINPTDQTLTISIPKNENSDKRSLTVTATQPGSGKKLNTTVTQAGKKVITDTTYGTPVITKISAPTISANGECAGYLTATYTQNKHIVYNDSSEEDIELTKTSNVVSVDDGSSTYPEYPVKVNNGEIIGTNLKDNETKERSVYSGSKITIISANNSKTYSGLKGSVIISQEANTSKITNKYTLTAKAIIKDNRTKVLGDGEDVTISVNSSKESSYVWTSGYKKEGIIAPSTSTIITDIGQLDNNSVKGEGEVTLSVPENTADTERDITVTVAISEDILAFGETKVLRITQQGKADVKEVKYGEPFNVKMQDVYYEANGALLVSRQGLKVTYDIVKTTSYTNGKPDLVETVNLSSSAKTFSGTDIYGLNITFDDYFTGSCNSLGKTVQAERVIMYGNNVTFNTISSDTLKSVATSFNVYQRENKVTSDTIGNYKIYMGSSSNKVPYSDTYVSLSLIGSCDRTIKYSSRETDVKTIDKACTLSTTGGKLSRTQVNGKLTESSVTLTFGENTTESARKFTVNAWLTDHSDTKTSETITQSANTNWNNWLDPVITSISYNTIGANGVGDSITVDYKQIERRRGNGSSIINVEHTGSVTANSANINKLSDYSGNVEYFQGRLRARNLGTESHSEDFKIGTLEAVSFNGANNEEYTFILTETYEIYQEKNVKTAGTTAEYELEFSSSGVTSVSSKGGKIKLSATGKKKFTTTWTSGAEGGSDVKYVSVGFFTSSSGCSFNPTFINECNNGKTTLTVGEWTGDSDRTITVSATIQEATEKYNKSIDITQKVKKVSSITYSAPEAMAQVLASIGANGKTSDKLILDYMQTKTTTYDDGTSSDETVMAITTLTNLSGVNSSNGFSISSDGTISCKSLGTTLQESSSVVCTASGTKITSKFDGKSYDIYCVVSVSQNKNIITNKTNRSYSITLGPNGATVGESGGNINLIVNSKETGRGKWSSGAESTYEIPSDYSLSTYSEGCSIDTSSNPPVFKIGKNPGKSERTVTATAVNPNDTVNAKDSISVKQVGISVTEITYSPAEMNSASQSIQGYIEANGTGVDRLTVKYIQTKTTHYSDGSSKDEIVSGTTYVTGLPGAWISTSRNFSLGSGGVISCDSLGKTPQAKSATIVLGTQVTFTSSFDKKSYTFSQGILVQISQYGNTWEPYLSSASYSLKLTPNPAHVGSPGGRVDVTVDGYGKGNGKWSSGAESFETFYPEVDVTGPGISSPIRTTSNGGTVTGGIRGFNGHYVYEFEGTIVGTSHKATCKVVQN